MPTELKNSIRNALAGSSSHQPVYTATLYSHGTRKQVQAALMELYQAQGVCCCKITKDEQESVVWWLSGSAGATMKLLRMQTARAKIAVGRAA